MFGHTEEICGGFVCGGLLMGNADLDAADLLLICDLAFFCVCNYLNLNYSMVFAVCVMYFLSSITITLLARYFFPLKFIVLHTFPPQLTEIGLNQGGG